MKKILGYSFVCLAIALTIGSCSPKQKCVEKINPNCVCTMQYDPVCGCNGKTYGNACNAACNGITEFTKGECPPK